MISISRLETSSAEDVLAITGLLKQLSIDPENESGITADRLHAVLASRTTDLFIVRDGEKLVGMATLLTEQLPSSKDGSVEEVVIDVGYRGQGLGEKLMCALVERARENEIQTLYVSSRPFRVEAHALYEKVGFKAVETMHFELDL